MNTPGTPGQVQNPESNTPSFLEWLEKHRVIALLVSLVIGSALGVGGAWLGVVASTVSFAVAAFVLAGISVFLSAGPDQRTSRTYWGRSKRTWWSLSVSLLGFVAGVATVINVVVLQPYI